MTQLTSCSQASTFTGPIGKLLPTVRPTEFLIILLTHFTKSNHLDKVPGIIWKDLSIDQKYMWRIVTALMPEKLDNDLELLKIGPCYHNRWLTTACRVCCLYASTKDPSETLIILTSYINIYAPMWFSVKHLN